NAWRVAARLGTTDVQVRVLPRSRHVLTRDVERDQVQAAVAEFLARYRDGESAPAGRSPIAHRSPTDRLPRRVGRRTSPRGQLPVEPNPPLPRWLDPLASIRSRPRCTMGRGTICTTRAGSSRSGASGSTLMRGTRISPR